MMGIRIVCLGLVLMAGTAWGERGPQDHWVVEDDLTFDTWGGSYEEDLAYGDGKLYLSGSDRGCTAPFDFIQVYSTDGELLGTIAEDQLSGSVYGVAYFDEKLYMADTEAGQVQVYTINDTFVTNWGTQGSAEGQFDNIQGIAVDSNYVYTVETGTDRLQVFDHTGQFIRSWGGAWECCRPV